MLIAYFLWLYIPGLPADKKDFKSYIKFKKNCSCTICSKFHALDISEMFNGLSY